MKKTNQKVLNYTVLTIASIFVSLFALFFLIYLDNKSNSIILKSTETKLEVNRIYRLSVIAESERRGYLLTEDSVYFKSYKESLLNLKLNIDRLSRLFANEPTQLKLLDELKILQIKKMEEMQASLDYASDSHSVKAFQMFGSSKGKFLLDSIQTITKKMNANENLLLSTHKKSKTRFQKIIAIVLAITFLLAVISIITIYKLIKPLIEKLNAANASLEKSNYEKDREIVFKLEMTRKNLDLIDDLQSKNKELYHFAYIASHDLQEPLRTVKNFISLFEEEYKEKLGTETNEYFRFINNALSRMSNLIAGLLQYSKIGKSDSLSYQPCNLVLNEVLQNIDSIVKESKSEIEIPQNLPTVYVYKIEFAQLFQNLIINAIKFKAEDRTPKIKISYQELDNEHQFSISDQGIGIASQHFEKIFNIFSKLHSTQKFSGQGIGLAFCKKIVELHKGRIWVESEIGVGSTFSFTINKNLTD